MVALSYDTAKNVAVAVAIGLAVLSLVAAAVIRTVATKVLTIVLMVGIGIVVWTQRQSLQDCAASARESRGQAGDTRPGSCSFLGFDITVP